MAAVTTVPELLEAYEREQPDVAVVDVRLPPTFTDEGIRGAVELRRARPGAPVLVLSQYVEERYARDLLNDRAEGIGYLLKDRVQTYASSSMRFGVLRPEAPSSTPRSSVNCSSGTTRSTS